LNRTTTKLYQNMLKAIHRDMDMLMARCVWR